MDDPAEERALRELRAVLDANAPIVRHEREEFPEGTPFLRVSLPGTDDVAVFLDDRQWICLSEPKPGRVPVEFVAGRIDDDPVLVVDRLVSALVPARRRSSDLARTLKASGVGLAAGTGVGLLGMLVMAVLVGGSGYLSDTTIAAVYVLAILLGAGAGLWAAIRWWHLG
ncbi:hypothetical protein [Streptosporangium sp. NPDC000396]|uniref:hypothetical protein n=1 Tax=Streptosporangium sp. NPDC000396 TaxID=3366185 RepID=UPI003691FDC1